MRIVSGRLRGRIVKMPKSDLVRPTTEKVKEALFNYLNHYIGFDGLTVCDIYAGSGSLGFEALSRGAEKVHFVEKNYAVYKNLEFNIKTLQAEKECKIYKMAAVAFAKKEPDVRYDLILADPPFFHNDVHEMVEYIIKNNILTDEGVMIIERSIQTQDEDVEAFGREPIKRMGDSLIYQWDNEEEQDN